jgi:hypothetical protein
MIKKIDELVAGLFEGIALELVWTEIGYKNNIKDLTFSQLCH